METTIKKIIQETGSFADDPNQVENLVHTHWRVHYDEETHSIHWEDVCINEYGSCFGIGRFGCVDLPNNMPAPDWGRFGWDDIPV
jgi:hypothetical protein